MRQNSNEIKPKFITSSNVPNKTMKT